MCGRSSLTKTEKELEDRFQATFYSDGLAQYNPLPNYNVAPSHMMPVITNTDKMHFQAFRWGLIPFWAKDIKIGYKMINARIETLMEKSSFKMAVSKRRCLVPADGFYEWKKVKDDNGKITKQPYRMTTKDQEVFAMAGLWDRWKSPDGQQIFSFTVITQPPNKVMKDIHNRMPAILIPEQESLWLADDIPPQELIDMITPYPDELLEVTPVSSKVNNVRNNHSSLLAEYRPDLEKPGTLF